jgi:alpha-beta hydrolase superfamily lysophospholipase
MLPLVRLWTKRIALLLGALLFLVLGWRAFDAWRSPSLPLWLTEVPDEPDARKIENLDWAGWLAAEAAVFGEVQQRVTARLTDADLESAWRFAAGDASPDPLLPWNRSQLLLPAGQPRGAVVLLHGLTDSPYSLRHVAIHYRDRGFVALAIRLPGHGTVPASLTSVRWEDWLAATRLAVRHAHSLVGEGKPLYLVGYSNGAALAMKYALDSLEDTTLPRPAQLVLISPMIGITRLARFAGVLGWPAVFPPFAKSAWLDIAPEYNTVKYNSFPVNAARQSSQLTRAVQSQLEKLADQGRLASLAPVLTFQSLVDYTVDVSALLTGLYARLPKNGSELVLFDLNSTHIAGALYKPGIVDEVKRLLPVEHRSYEYRVVSSQREVLSPLEGANVERLIAEGYPRDVYSLSHVALPFPEHDDVYGVEGFGGRVVRGERGTLAVSAETLMRMTWNPFFPYLLERIDATLPGQQPGLPTGQ